MKGCRKTILTTPDPLVCGNKINIDGKKEVGCDKDMFSYKVKINYAVGRASPYLNWFFNPLINISDFTQQMYCRFLCFIFPSAEIQYELEVLKWKHHKKN